MYLREFYHDCNLIFADIHVKRIECILNDPFVVIESFEIELGVILKILCALAIVRTTKCRPFCTAKFLFGIFSLHKLKPEQ